METLFRKWGYSVTVVMNQTSNEMKKAINQFSERQDHYDSAILVKICEKNSKRTFLWSQFAIHNLMFKIIKVKKI